MDRGAWWATVHGDAKSQTRLSNFTFFLSSRKPALLPEFVGSEAFHGSRHSTQLTDCCFPCPTTWGVLC